MRSIDAKMKRELMTREDLIRQSNDYFDIADQENLEKPQRDRLRRAAIALQMCAQNTGE